MCSDLLIEKIVGLKDSCVLRILQNLQKYMTEFTVKLVFRLATFLNEALRQTYVIS